MYRDKLFESAGKKGGGKKIGEKENLV